MSDFHATRVEIVDDVRVIVKVKVDDKNEIAKNMLLPAGSFVLVDGGLLLRV